MVRSTVPINPGCGSVLADFRVLEVDLLVAVLGQFDQVPDLIQAAIISHVLREALICQARLDIYEIFGVMFYFGLT